MSQQPPPQGPYGQPQSPYGQPPQDPYTSQPGFSQPAYPGYPQYATPKKPLDLGKLVTIAAWVVLGLHAVAFLYVSLDAEEFDSAFFGSMPTLGQGIFFTGVLLGLGQWLDQQTRPD